MELDQRVKALEYEMKILKNEIQRTLLDIQEQILVHYYPTLRAEDSAPPAEAVAQIANRAAAAAAAAAPVAPVMKKVSLDEVRTAPAASAPRASGSVDQAAMVKLLEWVNDSIARLGSKRTGKLIETCVARTILDNDTKAILLRLTSLNQQPDPAQVPANDALTIMLRLDEVLGRAADIDEALTIIEEAGLG